MPSLYEEFGGVSIEALATGIPVVAFAVGGLIEILGGITPDLLVAPEDTRELITRVLAVLAGDHAHMNDPAKLTKYAMERYCQEEMGGRLLTLYQVITES
jgi:2-deoxystreptamine N-acetyl-D-glucosaminyltransferase/2-deoxystreptamine glucosyltransferase